MNTQANAITLSADEWNFGRYEDVAADEWRAFKAYEYIREAMKCRTANGRPKKLAKYVDVSNFQNLAPGFPNQSWLNLKGALPSNEMAKVVRALAPTLPPLIEVSPQKILCGMQGAASQSYKVTEIGPWLFEFVTLQISRNYSDKDIIEAFSKWLKEKSSGLETGRERLPNLSVRGLGARKDWEALKFLAARRLYQTQVGDGWKQQFNRVYATRFETRQVKKSETILAKYLA